jgi:hypothetical protein
MAPRKDDHWAEILARLNKLADKLDELSDKLNNGLGNQSIQIAKVETRLDAVESAAKAQRSWIGRVAATVIAAMVLAAVAMIGLQ